MKYLFAFGLFVFSAATAPKLSFEFRKEKKFSKPRVKSRGPAAIFGRAHG
ncbi:hypothetical protein BH10BDE1_BH10BDE1_32410 [soil metagenome]